MEIAGVISQPQLRIITRVYHTKEYIHVYTRQTPFTKAAAHTLTAGHTYYEYSSCIVSGFLCTD